MPVPCRKESEINSLFKSQAENRDILIETKTLVESLVKYQLEQQKEAITKTNTDIVALSVRLGKVENLGIKILAWASVGGVVGGFIANFIIKKGTL